MSQSLTRVRVPFVEHLGIKVTEQSKSRAAIVLDRRPELLNKYPWPARSPDGRVNVASMLDIQAWYVKSKLANVQFPAERIIDATESGDAD